MCKPQTLLSSPNIGAVRGVAIHGSDGRITFNFPHHHHRNGKLKRSNTDGQFKKVVRRLRRSP